MTLTDLAPVIAGVSLVAFVLVTTMSVVHAWRSYQATQRTYDAAAALVLVHGSRLDATIGATMDHGDRLAIRGGEVAAEVDDLRRDAAHARWLLSRVPESRLQLRTELLNMLRRRHDDR